MSFCRMYSRCYKVLIWCSDKCLVLCDCVNALFCMYLKTSRMQYSSRGINFSLLSSSDLWCACTVSKGGCYFWFGLCVVPNHNRFCYNNLLGFLIMVTVEHLLLTVRWKWIVTLDSNSLGEMNCSFLNYVRFSIPVWITKLCVLF